MLSNVQVGCDPELFLRHKETGDYIPSIGLIGGTKHKPRPIDDAGSCVQEDNVAVEFNIKPAKTKEEFIERIEKVIVYLNSEVAKLGLTLDFSASAVFRPEYLQSKQAKEFGCEPDLNCWTGEENPKPKGPKNLRSCGGHVHIGWDNPNMQQRIKVARAADLFIGALSCIYDDDLRRRKLYGLSGACRFKPYGIEHRTSSNYWIKEKALMGVVFDQAHKAVNFVNNGFEITPKYFEDIQTCINTGDRKLFDKLNAEFSIV